MRGRVGAGEAGWGLKRGGGCLDVLEPATGDRWPWQNHSVPGLFLLPGGSGQEQSMGNRKHTQALLSS